MKLNPDKISPNTKRTLDALHKALETLLQKRSFEEIKVADICELAEVPRSTFYSYFEDKFDYLDFFLIKFNYVGKNGTFPLMLSDMADTKKRHEAYDYFLTQLESKRDMYLKIHAMNHEGHFSFAGTKCIRHQFTKQMEASPNIVSHKVPTVVLADFLCRSYYVFWSSWLFRTEELSKEDLFDITDKVIAWVLPDEGQK